jgi:hypothetical protein
VRLDVRFFVLLPVIRIEPLTLAYSRILYHLTNPYIKCFYVAAAKETSSYRRGVDIFGPKECRLLQLSDQSSRSLTNETRASSLFRSFPLESSEPTRPVSCESLAAVSAGINEKIRATTKLSTTKSTSQLQSMLDQLKLSQTQKATFATAPAPNAVVVTPTNNNGGGLFAVEQAQQIAQVSSKAEERLIEQQPRSNGIMFAIEQAKLVAAKQTMAAAAMVISKKRQGATSMPPPIQQTATSNFETAPRTELKQARARSKGKGFAKPKVEKVKRINAINMHESSVVMETATSVEQKMKLASASSTTTPLSKQAMITNEVLPTSAVPPMATSTDLPTAEKHTAAKSPANVETMNNLSGHATTLRVSTSNVAWKVAGKATAQNDPRQFVAADVTPKVSVTIERMNAQQQKATIVSVDAGIAPVPLVQTIETQNHQHEIPTAQGTLSKVVEMKAAVTMVMPKVQPTKSTIMTGKEAPVQRLKSEQKRPSAQGFAKPKVKKSKATMTTTHALEESSPPMLSVAIPPIESVAVSPIESVASLKNESGDPLERELKLSMKTKLMIIVSRLKRLKESAKLRNLSTAHTETVQPETDTAAGLSVNERVTIRSNSPKVVDNAMTTVVDIDAARYAAIPDVGDRAFAILVDLGMVEVSHPPVNPEKEVVAEPFGVLEEPIALNSAGAYTPLGKTLKAHVRKSPWKNYVEKELSARYEAIPDVGDRAFAILADLNMVTIHNDPASHEYDHGKDDEYAVCNWTNDSTLCDSIVDSWRDVDGFSSTSTN